MILLLILVSSVIIHEISHGLAALALGDKTAKNAGRLSLNPIKHIDPFGSIILPIILIFLQWPIIGYAKPVPINPRYFKDQRKGMMLTALAGPFSNFLLAVISAGLLSLIIFTNPSGSLARFLTRTGVVNIFLCIINLIPVPPLDGSKVLVGLLPRGMLGSYYKFEYYTSRYFIIIFLMIIFLYPGGLIRILAVFMNPLFNLLGIPYHV